MENNTVKQQNVTIIHKGFLYVIWQVIIFPFKVFWKILRWVFSKVAIYHSWYRESQKIEKKSKEIKRYFTLNKDEEVL